MADDNPPDVVDSACNRWLFHAKAPVDPKSKPREQPTLAATVDSLPDLALCVGRCIAGKDWMRLGRCCSASISHSSSCTRGKTGSSSLVEAVPTLCDSHCCCRRSSMNAG
eukprot:g82641.t1